jgi:hypothetical protein
MNQIRFALPLDFAAKIPDIHVNHITGCGGTELVNVLPYFSA